MQETEMHIMEPDIHADIHADINAETNYVGYFFLLCCFFAFVFDLNPELNQVLKQVLNKTIKFIEKNVQRYNRDVENRIHFIFTGEDLYTDDDEQGEDQKQDQNKQEQNKQDQGEQNKQDQKEKEEDNKEKQETPVVLYEDKYVEKFRKFPNTYVFTDSELEEEATMYNNLKKTLENDMASFQKKLLELEPIIALYQNEANANQMLQHFGIVERYAEDPDDFDLDELFNDLKTLYNLSKNALNELTALEPEDYLTQAREAIINKKLDNYKNNYILETTPMGNVYMRYNNYKQSFEYFSNSTIPYRYLETIGRKYVMTYWCKPLFIDLAEEMKKAKEKQEENQKTEKQENQKTEKQENQKTDKEKQEVKKPTTMYNFKKYNANASNSNSNSHINKPSKNRVQSDFVLPPQIKANLPNVNSSGEKQLLKESSNRYTWEGRIANLTLLKSVDKKKAMSFADFKLLRK